MSVFSKIFDKIFHRGAAATPADQTAAAPSYPDAGAAAAAGAAAGAAAQQPVDVEAVLNGLAAKNPQKLNWRTSIVDLMKLLDLDSSLQERKDLATELGYTGAKDGSAEMNTWLHRQVMNKLAANGGKVPADLKD
jgi:3-oxoacyl-ACP reductase-like protein